MIFMPSVFDFGSLKMYFKVILKMIKIILTILKLPKICTDILLLPMYEK